MDQQDDSLGDAAHLNRSSNVSFSQTSYRYELPLMVENFGGKSANLQIVSGDTASMIPKFLLDLKESAEMYALARKDFGATARKHVVFVGRVVCNRDFSIDEFAAYTGQKLTKPDRQNKCRVVFKFAHQHGDPKVISNLSLLLNYVIGLSNNDPDEVEAYFSTKSIKQALREYRASRKQSREDSASKPEKKGMTLIGAPADMTGVVTIRIEIIDGTARFLDLLEV